ncbi:MAG: AAA family ATPase, partial [Chloroflexi bacterium]|nr:AAA family ATPase [Chloroflexota bacterium]
MNTHNAFPTTIYVLGTDRDIGKTVTCIGIMAKLLTPEYGYGKEDIAYMKPVGQETLTVVNGAGASIQVDKDAVLITSLLELPTYGYDQISPVVWQGGLTSR